MEKLTAEQKDWEKKIKEQHKMMGGVHMSAAHTAKTQKEIRTLENRLDKVCGYYIPKTVKSENIWFVTKELLGSV